MTKKKKKKIARVSRVCFHMGGGGGEEVLVIMFFLGVGMSQNLSFLSAGGEGWVNDG